MSLEQHLDQKYIISSNNEKVAGTAECQKSFWEPIKFFNKYPKKELDTVTFKIHNQYLEWSF